MTEITSPGLGSSFQPDSDVHITLQDQQKINSFAKFNAKHDDVKSELKAKQNELKNLEDAAEELVLLDEESATIPFLTGEIFIHYNVDETNSALEAAKKKVLNEIKDLEEIAESLKSNMSDLKTQLYGKFGNHINLERGED